MTDRISPYVMPSNIEAEQALLGILLFDPQSLGEVEGRLKATEFYLPLHQLMYQVLLGLAAGDGVSLPAVHGRMAGQGGESYRSSGAYDFLYRLAERAPPTSSAGHYLGLIKDAAVRRFLCRKGDELREGACSAEKVVTVISHAEWGLLNASRGAGVTESVVDGAGLCQLTLDTLDGRGRPDYLKTGFRDFDREIGGLQVARMNIFAARPKMGKTAVAICVAVNVASSADPERPAKGVHFISLEMDRRELANRAAACAAFVRGDRGSPIYALAAKREMGDLMARRMVDGARRIHGMPLTVDDRAGLTPSDIAAAVKRQMREWEKSKIEPGLVIVDHLGLARPDNPSGNKVADVGEVSGAMRDMFKEIGVTGLCLSQLSREVDKRGVSDHRPQLSDLRWSGDLEQDAAQVTFIYRPAKYLREPLRSDPDFAMKMLKYEEDRERYADRVFLLNEANRGGESNFEIEMGMAIGCNAMWDLETA